MESRIKKEFLSAREEFLAERNSKEYQCERALAINIDTPPEALAKLAHSSSDHIRYLVGINPNTPNSTVEELRKSGAFQWVLRGKDPNQRWWMARKSETRPGILEELAKDKSKYVRESVACNPNCPEEALEYLSKSKNPIVLGNIFACFLKKQEPLLGDTFDDFIGGYGTTLVESFCKIVKWRRRKFDGDRVVAGFVENGEHLNPLENYFYNFSVAKFLEFWTSSSFRQYQPFECDENTLVEIFEIMANTAKEAASYGPKYGKTREFFEDKDLEGLKSNLEQLNLYSFVFAIELKYGFNQDPLGGLEYLLQRARAFQFGLQDLGIETVRNIIPIHLKVKRTSD